jgi:tetratricopeptide (TPR) repeat protein
VNKRFTHLLPILFGFAISGQSLSAADALQGAIAILRQTEVVGTETKKESSPAKKLLAEIKAFPDRAATIQPADAAAEWLRLVDAVDKMSEEGEASGGMDPYWFKLSMPELVAALPPPETWKELARQIESRPKPSGKKAIGHLGLRLLANILIRDRTAQLKVLAEYHAAEASKSTDGRYRRAESPQFSFFRFYGDTNASFALFEDQLARAEKANGAAARYVSLSVPDLSVFAEGGKQDALLRRILLLESENVYFSDRAEKRDLTTARAREIALEMIDKLPHAWWQLCESTDAVELFEAFEKKFSGKTQGASTAKQKAEDLLKNIENISDPAELRAQMEALQSNAGGNFGKGERRGEVAKIYYLGGLVLRGRTGDAARVARTLDRRYDAPFPTELLEAISKAGKNAELDEFLYQLLKSDAALPYWNSYIAVSAMADKTSRMLELVRTASEKAAKEDENAPKFQTLLVKALLAADELTAAAAELGKSSKPVSRLDRYEYRSSPASRATSLARLGLITGNTNWLEEGISKGRTELEKQITPESFHDYGDSKDYAELLIDSGRYSEAEAFLGNALTRWRRMTETGGGSENAAPILTQLARLYHRSNRPQDVLEILEKAPWWGVGDLGRMRENVLEEPYLEHGKNKHASGDSLAYFAAHSLIKTGRRDEGRRIAEEMIRLRNGYDPAYELLIELDGEAAIGRLDELFAKDPFEERPLIWKAELLRRAARFEQAENVVRQAIRIDPSDGEQGAGRRMRVYSVLADIREARGDAKEAALFRGAVRAIRMAEQADVLHEAGLLARAVRLYKNSLEQFADAYCIQSRLAVQLASLGRHDEALKHYQRAFELMPDSFGRMESHCFGCEGTFSSKTAQGVAETTFQRLLLLTPDKPQLHYLMGYLRSTQGRHKEASVHYRKAVSLDRDYLNAWQKLAEMERSIGIASADAERAAINILRLDPLSRHSHVDTLLVENVADLWRAVTTAARWSGDVKTSSALFPLTASKEKFESLPPEMRRNMEMSYDDEYEESDPRRLLSQQALIQIAVQMRGGGSFGGLYYDSPEW